MLHAHVENRNRLPRLIVNGEAEAPCLFFLRAEKPEIEALNREQVAACARTGMHLYTFIVPVPFLPPAGGRDFSKADAAMRIVIESDPEAKILVRVGLSPSGEAADEYCARYPEDKMLWRIERKPDHTSVVSATPSAVSMASDRWFGMAKDALRALHEHFSADPYFDDHLLGYHIGCGETGEWFYYGLRERGLDYCPANQEKYRAWLRKKYGGIRALEEAWHIAPGSYDSFERICVPGDMPYQDREIDAERTLFLHPGDQRYIEYYDYSSELVSDRMTDIAGCARSLTNKEKLLVFFYGYYFEVYDGLTGHFRLNKVLDCPDIDALTSPVSYNDRNHGGVGALMSPADSVTLHGKLWIVENDIRTSNVVCQDANRANYDWIPRVNSIDNLLEVITRETGHMLSHNLGCWYMDLLGYGWHHHPRTWAHIGKALALYRRVMANMRPLEPEVAVVVDENAMSLATHAVAVGAKLLHQMRTNFYRAGVKFGIYAARDYEAGLVPSAKAVFFLNPFDISPARAAALAETARRSHATLVFLHGFGRTDADSVRLLTGMDIRATDIGSLDLRCVALEGAVAKRVPIVPEKMEQRANPASYIAQNRAAQPLAVYDKGALAGRIAAARCAHDGFASVFAGPLCITSDAIREICRLCGAHIYVETNDAFIAGNGVYLLHTNFDEGERTVTLPAKARIARWPDGERVESDTLATDGRNTASYLWLDEAYWG